tara:strand:- start:4890 stop:6800 length:1911 start_codon:yes stop_codon:yes gene_type:complete
MKLTYSDILDFLIEKPSIDSLSKNLFQLGHEHEIEDQIFNMEFTPNRGDCLSLDGLAQDLNFFYGKSEALDIYQEDIEELEINFENLSKNDCPEISFLKIEIDKPALKFNDKIESYFKEHKINKTNFFVDISNYVSYELGLPLHCYDGNYVKKDLTFCNKECDDDFETLLNNKIKLSGKNCVFMQEGEIINLAGVMGGSSTSCSQETTQVLVECAYFKPESIIGKSVKYNLASDAAHKFERGVDRLKQERTLRRFIKIVEEHSNIKSIKLKSFNFIDYERKFININKNAIESILGISLKSEEFLDYLNKLGFIVNQQIEIPSHRHDIFTQNDIAEEVARLIGYNEIQEAKFDISNLINKEDEIKLEPVRDFLIKRGFNEIINYPFSSLKVKESIVIDNPLDINKGFFRLNLKDSLINNLLYNERRQKDSVKMFEISDIYYLNKNLEIQRSIHIGIIATGRVGYNHDEFAKKIDKEFLENSIKGLFKKDEVKFELISREGLNSRSKDKIYYLETELGKIENLFAQTDSNSLPRKAFSTKYVPISEFPSSSRDFSFLISDLQNYSKVIQYINEFDHKYLKDSFIFDFYKDQSSHSVKLGVRIIFQSHEKTLAEKEIVESYQELLNPILKLSGVSIPGL